MWRILTEDDIVTSLTGPETTAFKTAALKSGQSDPLVDIIASVTDEVRGYIGGCANNRLGDGDTMPRAVIHHAVALVRFRFMTRLTIKVSDERELEYKDARSFLRDVSSCKVAIEQPATPAPADEQGRHGGTEVARQGKRITSRKTLKGL